MEKKLIFGAVYLFVLAGLAYMTDEYDSARTIIIIGAISGSIGCFWWVTEVVIQYYTSFGTKLRREAKETFSMYQTLKKIETRKLTAGALNKEEIEQHTNRLLLILKTINEYKPLVRDIWKHLSEYKDGSYDSVAMQRLKAAEEAFSKEWKKLQDLEK